MDAAAADAADDGGGAAVMPVGVVAAATDVDVAVAASHQLRNTILRSQTLVWTL